MKLGLAGKHVVVAGASRGIGLSIARAFALEEARVSIAGRNAQALALAREHLRSATVEAEVAAFPGDMTDRAQIEAVLQAAAVQYGPPDVVVANVGNGAVPAGWDQSEEIWASVFRENFFGSMALARAALPALAQTRGSLVFVSSIVAREDLGAPLTYTSAKAALESAMKNIARSVGSQGVRVNAVCPGNILFPGGSWEAKLGAKREVVEAYIAREVPLKRFGAPEEIADAVVFLASDRASFITGAVLVVDGGQTRSL